MTAIAAGYFTFTCAGVGGEWRRIASIDISAGDECPTGWNKSSHNGVSFCRSPSDNPGCTQCMQKKFYELFWGFQLSVVCLNASMHVKAPLV